MSVRASIQHAVSAAAAKHKAPEKPYEWTYSNLYAVKKILDRDFLEDPEGVVARIRTAYARKLVDNPYSTGREYVTDWFEKHGFSDKDAKEMRRRINAESQQ